ncbi:hypothetical protein ACU4GH_31405 [Bradyrhizobium betae]
MINGSEDGKLSKIVVTLPPIASFNAGAEPALRHAFTMAALFELQEPGHAKVVDAARAGVGVALACPGALLHMGRRTASASAPESPDARSRILGLLTPGLVTGVPIALTRS